MILTSMIDTIKQLDIQLIRLVNSWSGNHVIDNVMIVISSSWPWIVICCVAAAYFFKKKNINALAIIIASLIALGCADYISFEIVKQAFRRERPCWELEGIKWVLGSCGGSFGFTSNHAANAGAVAMTLWLNRTRVVRWMVVTAMVLAMGVGFSRVYLGVHYPGDVLGGYVLGGLVAAVLHKTVVRRWTESIAKLIVSNV